MYPCLKIILELMSVLPCVCSEMSEVLRDKERRAQQQLERCAEERGRKMEEQRRKEHKRRAAAEEKRRQQQEAEKVRGRSTLTMHSLRIRAREKTGWHLTAVRSQRHWKSIFTVKHLNKTKAVQEVRMKWPKCYIHPRKSLKRKQTWPFSVTQYIVVLFGGLIMIL